jgi:hypothetical protein
MARCGSFGDAGRVMGVEDMGGELIVAELERLFGEDPAVSPAVKDVPNEGAAVRTLYFGSSTITLGKIKEIE